MSINVEKYAIVVKSSPKPKVVILAHNNITEKPFKIFKTCDTNLPQFYYCGFCSGILTPTGTVEAQCFHCQTVYENINAAIDSHRLATVLPSSAINYLRKNKIVDFDHNQLMKTRNKDKYRLVYMHFKSFSTSLGDSPIDSLINHLDQIFNEKQFTNFELNKLNDQYNQILSFYIDSNHLSD